MPNREFYQPSQVVNLPYRVYQSFCGRNFMGHTPFLTYGENRNAWGGLLNPMDSGINLFINTFTVSNLSEGPVLAELWLNAWPEGDVMKSPFLSPANTAITPLPIPKSIVVYSQNVKDCVAGGANIFGRIIGAHSTEVGNYYGKIIVPPGGSFIVCLHASGLQCAKADIAFGWWESARD